MFFLLSLQKCNHSKFVHILSSPGCITLFTSPIDNTLSLSSLKIYFLFEKMFPFQDRKIRIVNILEQKEVQNPLLYKFLHNEYNKVWYDFRTVQRVKIVYFR